MRFAKRLGYVAGMFFILLNILAAIHACKFTHFTAGGERMDKLQLTPLTKAKLLFTGPIIPGL
jgi:hypothetical protein